jgi:hypothetical protein
VQRSDAARGRYPLVALGSLAELERTEVRGCAVLVGGPVQRAHELAVVARGAAGLVVDGRRLVPRCAPMRTTAIRSPTPRSGGSGPDARLGVVVSPDRGAALRARLAAGEKLEIEVDYDCERYTGEFTLVSAQIAGELPGEVLITRTCVIRAPGRTTNASGSAATLECARVLAALADRGELPATRRTLRFLWMPEFTGTYAWQALAPRPRGAHAGGGEPRHGGERQQDCGSTLLLEHAPHFLGTFADELLGRIRTAAQDWVRDFSGPGHYSLARLADVPYSGGQ